jgi:hypothetical protein
MILKYRDILIKNIAPMLDEIIIFTFEHRIVGAAVQGSDHQSRVKIAQLSCLDFIGVPAARSISVGTKHDERG